MIDELTCRNPKYSDTEIIEMFKRAVRGDLLHEHELEDPTAFETLVRKKEIGNLSVERLLPQLVDGEEYTGRAR